MTYYDLGPDNYKSCDVYNFAKSDYYTSGNSLKLGCSFSINTKAPNRSTFSKSVYYSGFSSIKLMPLIIFLAYFNNHLMK